MYPVLCNRTYEINIESVEDRTVGSQRQLVVTGWAIDKMRHEPLELTATCEGAEMKVDRIPRSDLEPVFGLPEGSRSGYRVLLPMDARNFILLMHTPSRVVEHPVSVNEVRKALSREYYGIRMRQIFSVLMHAWTKQGMKALLRAVKRRIVPTQSFYESWIKRHETMTRNQAEQQIRDFERMPLISIVTPVYNVDEVWLRKFVDSVRAQWYPNWELCLADDHSSAPHIRPLLEELASSDKRIKVTFREENGQISRATNSAIELATGDFVGFMDNDDELAPQALFAVAKALNEDPEIDFIYTDEDKISEQGQRFDPFFKPDWSPHLLLGHNYITHFVVVSRQLLNTVGLLRPEYNGSQDYDFVLRATEQAHKVHHIAQMLYHWRTIATSVAGDPRSKMYAYEAGQAALEAALQRRGIHGSVRMLDNLGTYKIDYAYEPQPVVVLASGYTESQFEKLRAMTAYPKVRFVNADHCDPNDLVSKSSEDFVVFLRSHKPKRGDWLNEMVNYAQDATVGAVGGKIVSVRERVVNVGVTLRALRSGKPFEMRGEWDEGIGYYFRDLLPRDMFAVTEDCMLVRREDFQRLGGFSEQLKPGLRGIDYCARLVAQTGKTTLWEPYAAFIDTQREHLTIAQDDITVYLKQHRHLTDPFAQACFPADYSSKQEGIKAVIDSTEVSPDGSHIIVSGWAVDLHEQEDVAIALQAARYAKLSHVQHLLRPDANAINPVPGDALLGFKATIDVRGGRKNIGAEPLALTFSTSTDNRTVKLNVHASPVLAKLKPVKRRIALLAHPRTTALRLKEKYWNPRMQLHKYHELIRATEQYDPQEVRRNIDAMGYQPLISVVIPVYNVDPHWLRVCVDSIRNQYYPNWELCLADDHSSNPNVRPTLEELAASDKRIKVVFREENGHISRATNSALEVATGEFVALMDNDDEIPAFALYEVALALNENRDLDLIYSDEDKIDERGVRSAPHFKPDYSPDLLLSTNYISHLGVYRKSILDEIGGFRVGFEGSQDYDLTLRFVENTAPERIHHIPKVLYHWRMLATSTASSGAAKDYTSDAGLRALESMIERRGLNATVAPTEAFTMDDDEHLISGVYDIHYQVNGEDLVSVIIPTKNGYDNVERSVNSIIAKTDYPNYEIILADNGSTNPRMQDLYRHFEEVLGERFRVEELDMPFNFSRINNLAAKTAKGKYLLFLNDDTEVISPSWMTRMVSFAQLNRVGVVGAKLSYPNETIQHAGIILGLGGVAGHLQVGFPRSYLGYFGRLVENVNYYAVTAACCMLKADDFWAAGGFDEDLAVAYNDVDLCIRVHDQLHRDNVWAHEVELYHYESVTRGYDVKSREKMERLKRESARFYKRYPAIIDNDPYYNPNLSRTSGNCIVREV